MTFKSIEEIEAMILTGEIFAWQIGGDPATLNVGIAQGRQRPSMWMSSGTKTVVCAQFHGTMQAALIVRFLDVHSDAIQSVINHYKKGE